MNKTCKSGATHLQWSQKWHSLPMICIRICPLQQLYLYFCNYPLQQLFSYLSLKIVVLVFAQYGSCFLLHIQLQPERLAGTDSRLDVGFGSSLALFFFSSCINDFVALITTLVYSFILGVIVSNSGVFVLQNAHPGWPVGRLLAWRWSPRRWVDLILLLSRRCIGFHNFDFLIAFIVYFVYLWCFCSNLWSTSSAVGGAWWWDPWRRPRSSPQSEVAVDSRQDSAAHIWTTPPLPSPQNTPNAIAISYFIITIF